MTFRTQAYEQHIAKLKQREARKIKAIGSIECGAIVRHKTAERWVILLPDMNEPGKWRIQYFDMNGFSGHAIYENQEQVINCAIAGDYIQRDDAALEKMQEMGSFQRGNFASNLIYQVNSGVMSYKDANAKLAIYDTQMI